MIKIDSNFDGGNIDVANSGSIDDIQLGIRRDIHADYRQWFYFRTSQLDKEPHHFRIINADQASYPEAWPDCSIVASYDRINWFRIPTVFDGKTLCFSLTPKNSMAYFALYPPYSYERHQDLIAQSLQKPDCELFDVIKTVENRQVEVLKVGNADSDKKNIWIIARQHPAETMAEWFIEGLLERLLSTTDQTARQLLKNATFYLVPNMNPDGSVAGNLRTNGAGIDLNRAWLNPSADKSPEAYAVLQHMENTGVDLFLDIHGDEEIPYVFPSACEGNPGYTSRIEALEEHFYELYQQANNNFQCIHGYPKDGPGTADLSLACNQIGQRFNCLSMTLEMPFKDNANDPDLLEGWSTSKSMALGRSVLEPIHKLLNEL